MAAQFDLQDWQERKIQEWLLLLLRYAITRAPADLTAAQAMADELDCVGVWGDCAPRFFRRTSHDVCDAMGEVGDEHDHPVLRTLAARIDHTRLRHAFEAAVGLRPKVTPLKPAQNLNLRKYRGLWDGLAQR